MSGDSIEPRLWVRMGAMLGEMSQVGAPRLVMGIGSSSRRRNPVAGIGEAMGGMRQAAGGGELDRLGDEVLDWSLGDAGGDGEGRLWTPSL